MPACCSRARLAFLAAVITLMCLVHKSEAVNTGTLTRDTPIDPGPTNGDAGIAIDPMYGARRSRMGEMAEDLRGRQGETHVGKDIVATEEDVVEKRAEDAPAPSRPENRRFLRGERA
ncbi:hypothetical protein NGA_0500400 [Nannochloropsis gaditana CCMP526]|uniref:uncharacterized protein n=1 Tax=Nannochloropsis gaditana (strain CCMP526) TaxID=1093141 RepID=UPI00029F5C8F|nr:hypothetical protein NGA_0500400 [Nannochloropsis gaditana CCMP526]EKU22705.1 hypothetical protein NGA_0500400 [Nannochloropsis gaditana CCMP526]|eukprot:XP_005853655.1 hypothetical protein NGA_0500400 [Nannochloropsis gaditana CCMP526]